MSSSFGTLFVVTTFGESHGPGVGVVVDGVPPGIAIEAAMIQRELDRRRPGQSALTSQRQEADRVEILSGVFEGMTLGTPIAMLVRNTDARSQDYDALKSVYRPGHADYVYFQKYGMRDHRGGGRSSGRETVGRVAAGALARAALATVGVSLVGGTVQVGEERASERDWEQVENNPVRCPDAAAALRMAAVIERARDEQDSVGGVVEVIARGVPVGWGDPTMAKLDAILGAAMLSIPATKGVEIGGGFGMVARRGSETNDAFDGTRYLTNFAGGISGGISNGAEIVVRVAVRPATSIGKPQTAATASGETTTIEIKGRHDPCICPRVVPVAESMMAIVLMDVWLRQRALRGREA
ncbi:MAG: chorismate synthase [Candidatus Eisenbacteria bacterium]|uniref:Chorismate synthase n=1 Tax=Eiseniibacteriota bacterium TaxID=2212470 RepID=A0A849SCH4_UNCEI|nr:chorismate synthase [Candidatus Eisenbacteria bacterium]